MDTGDGVRIWDAVLIGSAAFFGVMARAARWTTPEGKFSPQKMLFEIATAPCVGMVAGGVGTYFSVDPIVGYGIAAFLGLTGPAFIEAVAQKWLDAKLGIK